MWRGWTDMLKIGKILFVLEMALVMAGLYFISDLWVNSMKDYEQIEHFPYNGIYYSSFLDDFSNGSFHAVKKEVEALPGFRGWSYTNVEVVGEKDMVISYDALSSRLFSSIPVEGEWFGRKDADRVPCVMVDNAQRDAEVGEEIAIGSTKYIVMGLVSAEDAYFDISSSYGNGNSGALSELKTGLFQPGYRTVICSGGSEPEYNDQTSVIAYFGKDTPPDEMKRAEQILQKEGVTETFAQMKQFTYRECYYKVMEYIPFCLLLFFVSLMGLVTTIVINSRAVIRKYGIVSLFGGRWEQIRAVYFGKLLAMLLCMALAVVVFAVQTEMFRFRILLISLLLTFLYAIIGTLVLQLIKGRKGIMECIRM